MHDNKYNTSTPSTQTQSGPSNLLLLNPVMPITLLEHDHPAQAIVETYSISSRVASSRLAMLGTSDSQAIQLSAFHSQI